MTYLGLTAIIAVRYLMVSGLLYWLLWGRPPEKVHARRLVSVEPRGDVVRGEIGWSLLSSFIYAAPAAIVLELFESGGTAIYADVYAYPLWYVPVSVLIYLALHDTYFYWTHRLMHRPRWFRLMHRVHHASRPPTPWASFSFHPYEAIVGALFLPLLAMVLPIHVGAVLFILVFMTVCAVLNHSGYEVYPDGWLRGFGGRHFITAAHHDLHHRRYDRNYGLYFRTWDRWMGTDVMETEYPFLSDSQTVSRSSTAP